MGVRLIPCSNASPTSESGAPGRYFPSTMPAFRLQYARSTCGALLAGRAGRGRAFIMDSLLDGPAVYRPDPLRRKKDVCYSGAASPSRRRSGTSVSNNPTGVRTFMRIRLIAASIGIVASLLAASPAAAQYGAQPVRDAATGEKYHIEVTGDLWHPTPDMIISSESLGIIGDQIDFVNDLGIVTTTFKQLKIVARPTTKSKFRFEYTPIKYTAETTVQRSFVFNGQRYTVGLPVESEVTWKAYRFGYEWDFLYRDRG